MLPSVGWNARPVGLMDGLDCHDQDAPASNASSSAYAATDTDLSGTAWTGDTV